MLEWLVTIGTAELGKALFEQVLKLGQAAAEDYVKDFFKGCLKDGIIAAKPEVAKKAVAEALKAFLVIVTEELEDQDLSKASIRDRYDPALIQFIQDEAVKPLLGQAFAKDCAAIEPTALATLWQQSRLRGQPFPPLPEAFDWPAIGSLYLKKVRRIVRETPELRMLLETELLEDIARNTSALAAQISPGFNVAQYRHSLQCSYGHLKLYAIDSTDRVDAIKLWQMFIEQTVREALPPLRYELPLDLQRQFQESGQLEPDLSPEALEHYRQDYFQQPSRKVLAAVADTQRGVILGDPGAGKSTLLQYLALEWVEGKTPALPLLIELREYAIAQANHFLDFLHRGRGVDWQFDQQQLHQHLQDQPTLVMFDGLDEVFDRPTQSAIIDDIIRFAQQYPQAQILITSRIIGYNPDRLQQANFRHFTLQPLDTEEIHEFIDRWYTLALGNDVDKPRLVTRLKAAIANSKAIQNLADNPLLLTMMAILNRRQELPRDRADLYDQASRVLLYHWDVDHKRLQLPIDTIGRREKQEMLRAIAYEMQAGDAGLQGNLISADRLTRILTDYLCDQGFSEPREKANGLIAQLRHRNWILCDRGADTYGFVHRTFLEYFCAMEIVHRFEKQRTLTFEQLRDEVFGQHWQDETWHEVLRLICGAIDPKFAGELIEFLMRIAIDRSQFLDDPDIYRPPGNYLRSEALRNLLLACECLLEIKNRTPIVEISDRLLIHLQHEVDNQLPYPFGADAALAIATSIAITWQGDFSVLEWLKSGIETYKDWRWFRRRSVDIIAQTWQEDADTLSWLKNLVQDRHSDWNVGESAVQTVTRFWKNNTDTLPWLKNLAQYNEFWAIRRGALKSLAEHWKDDSDTLPIVRKIAQSDERWTTRRAAVDTLAKYWGRDSDLFELFYSIVINDPGGEKGYLDGDPRFAALRAIVENYSTHPKTLELLRDRATNDPDEQLRQWAAEQLKMQNVKFKIAEEEA